MQIIKKRVVLFVAVLCASSVFAGPSEQTPNNYKTVNHAFVAGEKLTYSISWSKVVEAGIAVMEVKTGKARDSRPTFQFTSSTHSVGMVETFYPVRDTVESIVDADELYSLSFHLQENHGVKKRQRDMIFDQENGEVRVSVNTGPTETFTVPERVQDALSSLYYMRTRHDYTVGKTIVVDIHDGGKTWAVEVHTLGRERIKTPAGEFDTIQVKTYPKYEGVFMHKGEIYMWVTDDERKIPVLMKSKISIGSIVATLIDVQSGKEKP